MTSLPSHPAIEWPTAYKIKRHRLARSVKLRARRPHGLEITVPPTFNVKQIPGILDDNKEWIINQLVDLAARLPEKLPDRIDLPAMKEQWKIIYMPCRSRLEIIERSLHELVLVGMIPADGVCRKRLTLWLKKKANIFLRDQLIHLSKTIALPFSSLAVRDQKTLWGSCSSAKAIHLNYKLIFLPLDLAHHVMIHELCHTRHLNHSIGFWRLVAKHDTNYLENRQRLRQAEQFVPTWVL